MIEIPNFNDVQLAHTLIKNQVHRTPVLTSKSINQIANCELFFKCENFQKVGAFKFRGASNAVLSLSQSELKYGVATHSSGNHAQALALAAKLQNIPAYIVMPDNSPQVKKIAVAGYSAEIIYCKPTLEARECTLNQVVERTGATFIHPYDNCKVISGQGTAVIELIEEIKFTDAIMTPVGGGGLLSGTSISVKALLPNAKIIAAEPSGADDAYQSFHQNKLIPSINPQTIADGLLTSLSERTFKIISNNVDDIIRVSEESIVKAMKIIWERMKLIIEPSSAVSLAAVLDNPELFAKMRIGIILSGGNVDLGNLPF